MLNKVLHLLLADYTMGIGFRVEGYGLGFRLGRE